MTVLVSETGAPFACWVANSSGYADLDAISCQLILRRGKFIQSKDAAGTPQRYTYTMRVRWDG